MLGLILGPCFGRGKLVIVNIRIVNYRPACPPPVSNSLRGRSSGLPRPPVTAGLHDPCPDPVRGRDPGPDRDGSHPHRDAAHNKLAAQHNTPAALQRPAAPNIHSPTRRRSNIHPPRCIPALALAAALPPPEAADNSPELPLPLQLKNVSRRKAPFPPAASSPSISFSFLCAPSRGFLVHGVGQRVSPSESANPVDACGFFPPLVVVINRRPRELARLPARGAVWHAANRPGL